MHLQHRYHLIYGHVTTRMPEGGVTKLWNVATDLAVNTHIADEIPTNGCVPGRGPFTELEAGLSADAYYKILQDDEQASEDDSDGSKDSSGDDGEGEGQGGQGDQDEQQDNQDDDNQEDLTKP